MHFNIHGSPPPPPAQQSVSCFLPPGGKRMAGLSDMLVSLKTDRYMHNEEAQRSQSAC